MSSKLQELRDRFQVAGGQTRRKLEIIQHSATAFEIRDNDGLVGYAKDVADVHQIIKLQFQTQAGARFHLNQADDILAEVRDGSEVRQVFVPQAEGPIDHRPEPGTVRREDIPLPPQVPPELQAAAARLRNRALSRPKADPLKGDKPSGQFGEADALDNPGDPQILYGTDPDPELGQS